MINNIRGKLRWNCRLLIENCLKLNPCDHTIRCNEPMKEHTTFKVGGPADCWIQPYGDGFRSFCAALLKSARNENIPVFILGGGANIVVSDRGIRAIVMDMRAWKGRQNGDDDNKGGSNEKQELVFKSGTSIDDACETALAAGLSGLEFLAGMPGTIGGAVWMNARCYGSEIADVLSSAECIAWNEEAGDYQIKRIYTNQISGFAYKRSPFQEMDCVILSASFNVKKGDTDKILSEMEKNRNDRKIKGHYLFPSAGSAFKNNREFGKPTGVIIDELGLKGLKFGGAQVAPFHGNIIINTGNAAASDIRSLTDEIIIKVNEKTGFRLEPEIIFAGDWEKTD